MKVRVVFACALAVALGAAAALKGQQPSLAPSRNVILVTLDGVRVEEVFGGLDLKVLASTLPKSPAEESAAYKAYWAPTAKERREKLMPFLWGTLVAAQGSIVGNPSAGARMQITNRHRFSYPGYAEILVGKAHDDVINSNDPRRNPNETILEFAKRGLGLRPSEVASFSSWRVFDWIVEHEPGTITSNAGVEAYESDDAGLQALNLAQKEVVPPWDGVRHDYLTFRFAMAHLKQHKPRLLHIALDETDDWAHDGRYDRLLDTLARTDRYLQELWAFVQSDPAYRGQTSLIITVDHGRGRTPEDWRNHGEKVDGAQDIWMAAVVPGTPARGEWAKTATVYQNQIAATIAALFGLDYGKTHPAAGRPIERLLSR